MRPSNVAPLCLIFAVACSSGEAAPTDPPAVDRSRPAGIVGAVDPFIGTANGAAPDPVANGASGATFPGAAAPFGLVQWSPDTPGAAPPGYSYEVD